MQSCTAAGIIIIMVVIVIMMIIITFQVMRLHWQTANAVEDTNNSPDAVGQRQCQQRIHANNVFMPLCGRPRTSTLHWWRQQTYWVYIPCPPCTSCPRIPDAAIC